MKPLQIRKGTQEDNYPAFTIVARAVSELGFRLGFSDEAEPPSEEALQQEWAQDHSLYEYIYEIASQYWVAEKDGQIIGFARVIEEDGLQELTEFFVLPGEQARGIGRQLLEHAFRPEQTRHCSIIATPELRAQVRYLKSGVYPQFPLYSFFRKPQEVLIPSELRFEAVSFDQNVLDQLARIDRVILEHRRDLIHTFLLKNRQGYLYYRGQEVVGYGYAGTKSGPFALLDDTLFPAALAHAETQAYLAQRALFAVEVPMVNRSAVDYLLQQGFEMGRFYCFIMMNQPFGKFTHYVQTSPMMFL